MRRPARRSRRHRLRRAARRTRRSLSPERSRWKASSPARSARRSTSVVCCCSTSAIRRCRRMRCGGSRSAYTTSPRSGCRNRYASLSTTSSRASIAVRTAASTSLVGQIDDDAQSSSWLVSRPIAATAPNTCRAVVVEGGDLGRDQIGQHDRNGLAGQVCGDEFSGEERVALSAGDHLVDERARGRFAEQRRHTRRDLVSIQPLQLDPTCRREPAQLRQSAPLRRPDRDLVGAVGADEHDPFVDEVAGEVLEQVPRHRVGPVQILEPDEHGVVGREVGDQLEHGDEQPALRRAPTSSGSTAPGANQWCSGASAGVSVSRSGLDRRTWRSRSASGASGMVSPPMCVDRPRYRRHPLAPRASLTIVVLPIPASPPTNTTDGSPLRASTIAPFEDGQLRAAAPRSHAADRAVR